MIIFVIVITSGQAEFIDQMFSRNHRLFYSLAYQIVHSKEQAEEVVQDSFLKIINNVERIVSISEEKQDAFCVVIVKNTAKNMFRGRDIASSDTMEATLSASEDMETQILEHVEIDNALATLSVDEQQLARMRWGNQMTNGQIAKILGINEATAKKRTQRLQAKLQNIMQSRGLAV